jgi:hypothetical protein
VKSVRRQGGHAGAQELARTGIVDAAFPEMLKASGVPAFLFGRGDQNGFAAALAAKDAEAGGFAASIV